jgi:Isocitrate/isopropylmalate dehydrogenase
MMPEDALDTLAACDEIYLGAVGWPTVPDHLSLWGLLLPIRRTFDQYVNLCPARLLRGVKSPLAEPNDLDITVVRENTEGEYSDSGGRVYKGTPHEIAVKESIFTRRGVERIIPLSSSRALFCTILYTLLPPPPPQSAHQGLPDAPHREHRRNGDHDEPACDGDLHPLTGYQAGTDPHREDFGSGRQKGNGRVLA